MHRRLILFACSAMLVAGACADDSDDASAGTGHRTDSVVSAGSNPGETGAVAWQQLDESGDLQEGWLEVPVNYDDPDGGTFRLYVVRNRADDPDRRIGTLLVNPGGPGFGGSMWAQYADSVFGDELLQQFDIIGWDPRGTGKTEPAIDCIDDYDRYYAEPDITPDDDDERQQLVDLAEDLAQQCVSKNAGYLVHVGTNNSARDIDRIRQAIGEDAISYIGFSYGSELGATWSTLFPGTVRAAVLDGAADPTADFYEGSRLQLVGFDSTLDTFLAQCSDDESCAFHNDGDADGAYDELMQQLDEHPIPGGADRPDVNRVVAMQATAQAMYSSQYWEQLAAALDDAQRGDGAGLMRLFDAYYQRDAETGEWGNELEAFQVISCMDTDERPTVEEADRDGAQLHQTSPRLYPGAEGDYFCTFFPPSADPRVDITGSGAGPILVVGTTGDPATPLSSTEAMADKLADARLLVVDADEHTGYGVNGCSQRAVDTFLIELERPPDGEVC